MQRVFCQLLGCWAMMFFISGAVAEPQPQAATGLDRSFCLDSMETVPDEDDDLVPIEIAVDGGCMGGPEAVISI